MAKVNALTRDLRSAVKDIERARLKANRRTADAAMRRAKELSSGVYKAQWLAALNHPYAQMPFRGKGSRGVIPYNDPAWINQQTGEFVRSWIVVPMPGRPGAFLLTNTASYAKFLETGTRTMIPRPMASVIEKLIRVIGPQFMNEEIARVVRARFGAK